ncbi:MarR family winged helix-turn-helix transcriptional regulator [Pilimelia columellifera]|uniref:MarR family transcriptional regulator n=1 Tax=Pilimelia columellifera subsp. columellifera TaxID=706583 RepID=A0ABP6AF75_9ACTN
MSEPPWLSDAEQRAWRAYLRMNNRLTAALGRQLQAGSQLSIADYEVLVYLTDTPDGRRRPYELQQDLDWEQSRLSHHLGRMQKRGLVCRQECPSDGRGAVITITDAGRQAIAAAAPGHAAAVRRLFFDALDAHQVASLGQLADQVLDRLANDDR